MTSPVEDTLSFNLEYYLSRLTLQPITHGPNAPPMPPPNARSTMTPLTLTPRGYRRLRATEPLEYDLTTEAAAYFSKFVDVDVENIQGLKLELQEEIVQMEEEFNPYIVDNAINVATLLTRFLLRSTETLLGAIDGSMCGWTFQTVHRPRKNAQETQALDPIVLRRASATGMRDSVKLVLLPLGPWEFTPRDFQEFTTLQRFDDTPNDPEGFWTPKEWVNADRMKAYLYDLCLDFDCPYFVVTSHTQWSFGSFSKYYTTAFMSPPISFDNQPTSIVEILMFWIHVSFEKPGTIPRPNVDEEENLRLDLLQKERQLHAKRFLDDDLGSEPSSEVAPPAKRRRANPESDQLVSKVKYAKQETAVLLRRPRPHRKYWKLRMAAKKQAKAHAKLRRDGSADSVISVDLSVAPSSADPLPEKLVPRRKNAAIERWRDLVAIIEEHGEVPQIVEQEKGKWVHSLACDPITGELTGDIERIVDRTCPSCGPTSPTSSTCSLNSQELAQWNQPTESDPFQDLVIHQWF